MYDAINILWKAVLRIEIEGHWIPFRKSNTIFRKQMLLKKDIRGIPVYKLLNPILKNIIKDTSHQKEIEKWIASFKGFLSLHKLTSLWHKERIRKGTKIRKHFL